MFAATSRCRQFEAAAPPREKSAIGAAPFCERGDR